jgi:hypothetical protein
MPMRIAILLKKGASRPTRGDGMEAHLLNTETAEASSRTNSLYNDRPDKKPRPAWDALSFNHLRSRFRVLENLAEPAEFIRYKKKIW